MSCGLPVISSDCESGPREILSPSSNILSKATDAEFSEYGILVPSGKNYSSCAINALEELLGSEEKLNYYRAQSLKRAMDYERISIIKEWIKLIEEN